MVFEINSRQIGWYFTPSEKDLIDILKYWMRGERFPELSEVQFLDHEPSQLTSDSVLTSLKEWFFLVRRYLNTEINNTLKGRQGSWRLFDETQVRNVIFDQFWNLNVIIGMKRHYCYYLSNGLPTSWVAYEYRLTSGEIPANQSNPNDPDIERAIIRLFVNGPVYDMGFFHFEDHQIVDLLAKRNQEQQEFPQFGFVHFFSKEPYQLPVFKAGEKRMYMLRVNDASPVDKWATPRGKWEIADHNTPASCSYVLNEARTRIIGGKRLRIYYDHEDKPTVWHMYEYYTPDQPYAEIVVRDEFFVVVIFTSDYLNSAPKKAAYHRATPQASKGGPSSCSTSFMILNQP